MTSMTLPTGGVVTFYYSNYLDSYNNYNRWISTETENGNSTNFNPKMISQCTTQPTGCQEKMTVERPSGDSRVYILTMNDGAWDGITQTYNGSNLLLTVTNNYNFSSYQCSNNYICNGAEYITASSSTATLNDVSPNLTATTCYTYAAPWIGKTSAIQEWDYSGSAVSCASPPTPNRETDYTYGSFLNGASLLTQESRNFNGVAFVQTTYGYDSNGNMTGKTEGLSGNQATTSYGYDSNGMRTSKTDPKGNLTSYSYGCSDGFLAQTTYPQTSGVSHVTKMNPDCSSGDPLSTTDQNGQVTTYGYDSLGRKNAINYPDGGLTTYQYPSPTEVVKSRLLSGSTYSTVTTNWDGYGRKSQVAQSDPAGDDLVTYSYDSDNRLDCTSNPQRTGSAPTNGSTCVVGYDALDRPTQINQPDGNTIQVSYSGNQATVTDENGNKRRYQYDAFHDLTAVWEPNASGTPSWETTYSYDPSGHVLKITQTGDGSSAARTRTFVYDSLGRLTSESTPEAGAKSYAYDANGNMLSSTTGRGTVTNTYDALNRMTAKTGPGINYAYTYDWHSLSSGGTVFTSTNPIGRLVKESNTQNAFEEYSYDAMGRIVSQGNCIPSDCTATSNIISAGYDFAGDLTSLTYPDGRVISQSYDSAQHLTGIQYASWNGQSVNSSYYSATGFAPPGELTNAAFGNGVQMNASFDQRQSIASLQYKTASQTLWSKRYTWAPNAQNLLQISDMIQTNQVYNYGYDPDNRLTSAAGGTETLISPATPGTGTISISGNEQSGYPCQTYCPLVYDSGTIYAYVDGQSIGETSYGEYDTPYTLSANLAASINRSSLVSAVDNGGSVTITSKTTGTASNYSGFSASVSDSGSDPSLFHSPSFSASTSGSSLTGGKNAVYSTSGLFSETYTVDPWGNQKESGNFNFQQSYDPATNRISASGYTYDAAGDLTGDGLGNTYAYNVNGMLIASNGVQYLYDGLNQRVDKVGGTKPGDTIYFGGRPIALYSTSNHAWTDLIWAGNNMFAEVAGTQTATPVYRLLDHEGSLVATTDGSGNVTGTNLLMPYGETLSSNTNDPYVFAGLYQDTEYGGDDAWYRNYSTEQSRWLTPDPYNGSYDLNNPQSFNRYMYVNANPLGYTDPSGLNIASDACNILPFFFLSNNGGFSNDVNNATKLVGYSNQIAKQSCAGTLTGFAEFVGKEFISNVLANQFSSGGNYATAGAYFADIQAAIAIGCSIDYNKTACGAPQLAWLIPGAGGDVGKAVGDLFAIGAAACTAGALSDPVCDVVAVYMLANGVYDFFYNLFGWGGPQFTGSLLPRPSDLGGLGTSPIGIPNNNLRTSEILGSSRAAIPNP